MVEWLITETNYQGMWGILHFSIFSGCAWILSMTCFKQKRVRAIGAGEMSRRLSMMLLYARLEGLLPNDTLFLQQALPEQPLVSCPVAWATHCRLLQDLERGREEDPEAVVAPPGASYLRCKREEEGTPEPALGLQAQGSSDPSLHIHGDRDKAHCPKHLNKSSVIFPCHCLIDSFLYLINLEVTTNFS